MNVKSFCKHKGITVSSYDTHLFERHYIPKYYMNLKKEYHSIKDRDIFVDKDKIINDIKNNKNYPTKFSYCNTIPYSKGKLYIPENNNKIFCSIDLKQANFNTFKELGLFDEYTEWKDFMKQYTNESILQNSKYIRSYIFGHLNPKYTQHLQKIKMNSILNKFYSWSNRMFTLGSDELIIELNSNVNSKLIKQDIEDNILKEYKSKITVDIFKLEVVKTNYGIYYTKTDLVFPIMIKEYRTIPREIYTQFVCLVNNLQIDEEDLYFDFNGHKCKFEKQIELI